MCHNKILDFVSGRKATGIMPILLYAILLSVAPKKMTDDRETFRTKPNGRWQPCVALSHTGIIGRQRQRGEEEKKRREIVSTGVKEELKREKAEVGGIIRSFSKNVEKT